LKCSGTFHETIHENSTAKFIRASSNRDHRTSVIDSFFRFLQLFPGMTGLYFSTFVSMLKVTQINTKAQGKAYLEHEKGADKVVYLSKGCPADYRQDRAI
jgi:hypothetical protein